MKTLNILTLLLFTSGCASFWGPYQSGAELMKKYNIKYDVIPKWEPPVGASSYCSPMTSAGGHCVSTVGGVRTRCTTYADGSMVCDTSP